MEPLNLMSAISLFVSTLTAIVLGLFAWVQKRKLAELNYASSVKLKGLDVLLDAQSSLTEFKRNYDNACSKMSDFGRNMTPEKKLEKVTDVLNVLVLNGTSIVDLYKKIKCYLPLEVTNKLDPIFPEYEMSKGPSDSPAEAIMKVSKFLNEFELLLGEHLDTIIGEKL